MNVLIRGVRFSMRIGRANCVKGILEPKTDSTDTKDLFYMGDADPDRVHCQPVRFVSSVLTWCHRAALQITDEEIKEFIRSHCGTVFHPVRAIVFLPRATSHAFCRRRLRASAPPPRQELSILTCVCLASRASASLMLLFSRLRSAVTPLLPSSPSLRKRLTLSRRTPRDLIPAKNNPR
jgi:hypothetical protein